MFDSSKSTRKFSRLKLGILGILLILFTSGYFINAYASTIRSDLIVTRTSLTTTTSPSTSSITASQGTSSESTPPTSNTTAYQSTNSTIAQTTSSTSISSTAAIYRIPQSVLRTEFQRQGLNSNGISFVASPTKVPYYIITRSTATSNSGSAIGLLYLDTDVDIVNCWGYDSYISTLILVNTTGNIQNLTIYGNMLDSYGYMITQSWLNTYVNRSVFEGLQFGVDAVPVTGATLSSTGIIDGVRDAGRIVVNDYQQLTNTSPQTGSISILGEALNIFHSLESEQSELSIAALVLLFAAAVAAFELKNTAVRYGVAVGSILFMGFYAVRVVSISDFINFTTLRFPPISRDTYFYVLYGGVLITSLIWGRVYCGYLCPFGTFTELLNKISPIKLKIPYKYQSKLRLVKYVIFALVVFEILQSTILYQIEPFGTFFFLSGNALAWIFLASILGASIFLNRFYCTYICPAGTGLALLSWFRTREIKRWPECEKCRICANQCARQAIKGNKISPFECMNCRDCEKLYLNTKLCAHYAKERILEKSVVTEERSGL